MDIKMEAIKKAWEAQYDKREGAPSHCSSCQNQLVSKYDRCMHPKTNKCICAKCYAEAVHG